MSKKNIKEKIGSCESYIDQIIPEICDVLETAGFTFTNTENEIIVNSNDKHLIQKVIREKLPVPKAIIKLMLNICQVEDITYVRKKISH